MNKHYPYAAYPKYPVEQKPSEAFEYEPDFPYIADDIIQKERKSSGGLSDEPDDGGPDAAGKKPFRLS